MDVEERRAGRAIISKWARQHHGLTMASSYAETILETILSRIRKSFSTRLRRPVLVVIVSTPSSTASQEHLMMFLAIELGEETMKTRTGRFRRVENVFVFLRGIRILVEAEQAQRAAQRLLLHEISIILLV